MKCLSSQPVSADNIYLIMQSEFKRKFSDNFIWGHCYLGSGKKKKTTGTLFLPRRFRKLKSASYANSFQTTTQTSFKDTMFVMVFFYCDHLCNCAAKKKSYIFNPFKIRKKIMKLRSNCFDDNIEIVTGFDRQTPFPSWCTLFFWLLHFSFSCLG